MKRIYLKPSDIITLIKKGALRLGENDEGTLMAVLIKEDGDLIFHEWECKTCGTETMPYDGIIQQCAGCGAKMRDLGEVE